MQSPFPEPHRLTQTHFAHLKRVKQKNSSYCGPATLTILLSFLGVEISQDQVVESSGVSHKIKLYGMTISELGSVIAKLFADLQFWYKTNASVSDLVKMVEDFEYPAGVEWQGVFDYEGTDEFDPDYGEEDDDQGHYSVITHVDTANNVIMLADPYRHYAGMDRRFTISDFERRWWDENYGIEDFHAMFVVTPKSETFPESLGMIRA